MRKIEVQSRAREMFRLRFIVLGNGSFPHEVAKTDSSFPVAERDEENIKRADAHLDLCSEEIRLETYLERKQNAEGYPCLAAWNEAGWTVRKIFGLERVLLNQIPEERRPTK